MCPGRVNFQAAVGMLGSTVLHHMNSYNRVLYVLALYKTQVIITFSEKINTFRQFSVRYLTKRGSCPNSRHAVCLIVHV